jgi:hypothetical protein
MISFIAPSICHYTISNITCIPQFLITAGLIWPEGSIHIWLVQVYIL